MDTLVRHRAAGKRGLRRWRCLVISVGRSAARNRGLLRRPRRCPVRRCADRRHVRARSDWRTDWGRRRIRGEPHPRCHAADANRSKHARCNGGNSQRHGARTGSHGAQFQGIAVYRRCADLEVLFSDVFEQIWELVTNGVPDGARNANACRFRQRRKAHGYVAAPEIDLGTRFDQSCESVPWQCSDGRVTKSSPLPVT